MLVLARKGNCRGDEGQDTIWIGDTKVVIMKVEGNRVTVGVEAPRNVTVLRGELKAKAL